VTVGLKAFGTVEAGKATVLFVDLPQAGNAQGRENRADRAGQAEAGEAKIEGRSSDPSKAVR